LQHTNPSLPPIHEVIPISPIITPSPPARDTRVISPLLPTRKRVRLAKPAKRVEQKELKINGTPPQGMNYFLDSRNREDKDQEFYAGTFKKRVRTFKPPPKSRSSTERSGSNTTTRRPPRIKVHTFELVDEDGVGVAEHKIYKDSNKFYGNLDKFSEYGKDCRDNDVQTTYEEKRYGEKRSAKVLIRATKLLASMKVFAFIAFPNYNFNKHAGTRIICCLANATNS
jgi:hypothetical protein